MRAFSVMPNALLSLGLALCLSAWAVAPARAMDVRLPTGPHPRVLLTQEEAPQIRQRAESLPWARAVRDQIIEEADALAVEALDIPHSEGQWSHHYADPEDGTRLETKSPTEHVNPNTGKVYSGWPYDQVYVTFRHRHWLGGVETLGAAYVLDPKAAYAERVRAILLEYASFYSGLRLHDIDDKPTRRTRARLYAQTLDESVSLCAVAMGYDAVYDAPCFSEEDHATIRKKLLLPMVETIRANDMAISNWQTWHNAGVGLTGLVLGDRDLVEWSVNEKSGLVFQLEHSVMDSGMWYEESPSYHWYALRALLYHFEGLARAGMPIYEQPKVKRLFDAPLRQLLPDQTFVAFHDSSRDSIASARAYYEIGYARYGEPAHAAIVAERDSLWALFWGADELPPRGEAARHLASSNEESEGLAILRDAANETVLFLDYGPGASGHNQPAKLNIVLYAHGDLRFLDPGRLSYAVPLHKEWYRQSVAHNTVTVNGRSQARGPGKLVSFASAPGGGQVTAACDSAYPGVRLERSLSLNNGTIADRFVCTAQEASTFDLPLHLGGALLTPFEVGEAVSLGDRDGYEHLRNVRPVLGDTRSFAVETGNGAFIEIVIEDRAALYIAEGRDQPATHWHPILLRRIQGREAVFAASYRVKTGPHEH